VLGLTASASSFFRSVRIPPLVLASFAFELWLLLSSNLVVSGDGDGGGIVNLTLC
jgi:hypothetical protein